MIPWNDLIGLNETSISEPNVQSKNEMKTKTDEKLFPC